MKNVLIRTLETMLQGYKSEIYKEKQNITIKEKEYFEAIKEFDNATKEYTLAVRELKKDIDILKKAKGLKNDKC